MRLKFFGFIWILSFAVCSCTGGVISGYDTASRDDIEEAKDTRLDETTVDHSIDDSTSDNTTRDNTQDESDSGVCEPNPSGEICNGIDDNCNNEIDEGFECIAGTRQSCGNCGERVCTQSCNWGPCTGEGVCAPGETQTEPCGDGGTRSRTCQPNCNWGNWSSCSTCVPGQTETESCGNCGTRTRTCRNDGTWGSWSACTGQGVCAPGTTQTCTTSCGSSGSQTCLSSCTWGTCVPPREILNFRDDDCDGIVDNGFSILVQGYNDCTGRTENWCPAGYYPRGAFKVNSQPCSSQCSSGIDYYGNRLCAGWLMLCAPTDDVILVKGYDDCIGSGGNLVCPSGYSWRGAFKVDSVSCSDGPSGYAYDNQELRSGWLNLCSRTGRESLYIYYDYCTGFAGIGCPNGTYMGGRWIPDVVTCDPNYPSSITTDNSVYENATIVYCVSSF